MTSRKKVTWATVTLTFEGTHHYPDADESVSFLSHPHRHTFHVTVQIEQFHNDRDIEYIQFKRWLVDVAPSGDLGRSSCEDVAEELYATITDRYPDRRLRIKVTEDGENGALVEWG